MLAAQNRFHHAIVLDMRFGEPAEIAELRAAERLHPRPRRQRDLGEVGVVSAVVDAVVKGFVDFVIALRIAALDQHAQFFMDILERTTLDACHALGGEAGAERLQFRHDFEHAGELLRARPRHHGGAVGAHFHQSARRQQADRLAHRRARNFESGAPAWFRRARHRARARRARFRRRAAGAVPRRASCAAKRCPAFQRQARSCSWGNHRSNRRMRGSPPADRGYPQGSCQLRLLYGSDIMT